MGEQSPGSNAGSRVTTPGRKEIGMKDRAPWEDHLIALYESTGEAFGRLPYGDFWYCVEDGILILAGGSTRKYVILSDL